MPAPRPAVSAAAEPKFGNNFDPWHSVGAGHQRPETRLPVVSGWRQSRSMKLSDQFKSRGTGGKRIFDTVGRGSENWDEKAKALIPPDVRARAQCSIADKLSGKAPLADREDSMLEDKEGIEEKMAVCVEEKERPERKRGIFDGLVIYINGSTYPLISDHKLKQVLAENGAKLSLHLGRRQVTHVILGKPSGTRGVGAGGGLAGSKLEKEIKRVGGCGVKYVGVEWVLESLKAGKRQSEAPFVTLKIAPKGQRSVYSMFKKSNRASTTTAGQHTG